MMVIFPDRYFEDCSWLLLLQARGRLARGRRTGILRHVELAVMSLKWLPINMLLAIKP